jgi:hypothetical protein
MYFNSITVGEDFGTEDLSRYFSKENEASTELALRNFTCQAHLDTNILSLTLEDLKSMARNYPD